jgi:hypothetical protein
MKTNLKDDIWIQGFDKEGFVLGAILKTINKLGAGNVLYLGKTSEVSEELANEVLKIDEELSYWDDIRDIVYINYQGNTSTSCFKTAIKSACNNMYCIIYKTNE